MKQIKNQTTSREVILTESKSMREEYINKENFDILDKIKAIPYLTKDMVVSVEQVANYYEVSKKAIDSIISRHRDELETDGITTLKGDELKEFKIQLTDIHSEETKIIGKRTANLIILTKKVMVKIAFYLQNNRISEEVKRYLLEVNPKLYKKFEEETLSVGYKKRYENGFEDLLYPLLGKYNKIDKQVRCGEYSIDYVINNGIAIEIDENGHEAYSKENEMIRELFILNSGYKLFRYNTKKDSLLEFIGEIIWYLHIEETKRTRV